MKIKAILRVLLILVVAFPLAILLVCVGFSFFGQCALWMELLSHFVAFYILASLIMAVILVRFKILAGVAVISLLVNLARVIPLYLPSQPKTLDKNAQEIRLMHLNCWGPKNQKPDAIHQMAVAENADIVCFNEIENGWNTRINQSFKEYPYKYLYPHEGGVGFVSKLPIVTSHVSNLKFWKRPRLYAELALKDGRHVSLIVAHPTIPLWQDVFACRNEDFAKIVEDLAGKDNAQIVVGDMNCTPWSYYFQKFLKDGHLIDSEAGFGPQASWSPRFAPFPLLPIDHVLVSPEIAVSERKIEGDAGSDHRPVFVKMLVPNLNK